MDCSKIAAAAGVNSVAVNSKSGDEGKKIMLVIPSDDYFCHASTNVNCGNNNNNNISNDISKMPKQQEQRDSLKTLPTQLVEDDFSSSDEDWMVGGVSSRQHYSDSDTEQQQNANKPTTISDMLHQKEGPLPSKTPPAASSSVTYLVDRLKKVVQDEERNKAARCIQHFFRYCCKNILCWHKEEIRYWQEQKLDVERRKQEELQDVVGLLAMGKQRIEVELLLEYDMMDDTGLDWTAYHQWSQEQNKLIQKQREEGNSIKESVRYVTGLNLHLRRDLSILWNDIQSLQDKTEVLKEEESKWRNVISCLEVANEKMEEVIGLEPSVMDALAMRLQKAKENEANKRRRSLEKEAAAAAEVVVGTTKQSINASTPTTRRSLQEKAAAMASGRGTTTPSTKADPPPSKADPPGYSGNEGAGQGPRRHRRDLDTSGHTLNSDHWSQQDSEDRDMSLYGYEIELSDNDNNVSSAATPTGARRRSRSRSRGRRSMFISRRRRSSSKPRKKDQGQAAAAMQQQESSPHHPKKEQERGRQRMSAPSSLTTRDMDTIHSETKKIAGGPYSAYWQPQMEKMNSSLSNIISNVMSGGRKDSDIDYQDSAEPRYLLLEDIRGRQDANNEKQENPSAEGNNNGSATTKPKRRSTLSRHLENELKKANLNASEDKDAASFAESRGSIRRRSRSRSKRRSMSISRRRRSSSKPRKTMDQGQTAIQPAPLLVVTGPGKGVITGPGKEQEKVLLERSSAPSLTPRKSDKSYGESGKKTSKDSDQVVNKHHQDLDGGSAAKATSGGAQRRDSDKELKSIGDLQETQEAIIAEDKKHSDTNPNRRRSLPRNLEKELQEATSFAADEKDRGPSTRRRSKRRAMSISRRRRSSSSKPRKKDQGEATTQQQTAQERGRALPRSSGPPLTTRTSESTSVVEKSKNGIPRSPLGQAQKKLVNSSILSINLDPSTMSSVKGGRKDHAWNLHNSAPRSNGHVDYQYPERLVSTAETRRRRSTQLGGPYQELKNTNEKQTKLQEAQQHALPAKDSECSSGKADRRSILGQLKDVEKEVKETVLSSPNEEDTGTGPRASRRRSKSRNTKRRAMSISRRRRSSTIMR